MSRVCESHAAHLAPLEQPAQVICHTWNTIAHLGFLLTLSLCIWLTSLDRLCAS